MGRVVLSKRWKSRTVMLTLAMLGVITSPALTNITVLAQTSLERSAISQSSADDAIRKPNPVSCPRNTSRSCPPNTGRPRNTNSGAVYIKKQPVLTQRLNRL